MTQAQPRFETEKAATEKARGVELSLARAMGAAVLATGLVGLVAPGSIAHFFGSFERPRALLLAITARDLVMGTGLLLSKDPAPWLRARALADAADFALAAANAAVNRPAPERTATGLLTAASATLADLALARSLEP